jgi:hypothetical protein
MTLHHRLEVAIPNALPSAPERGLDMAVGRQ